MTISTLLIGPTGHGGEGVYVNTIHQNPPEGVNYEVAAGFHTSSAGAACLLPVEVALNRLVVPYTIPDIGIRAMRLRRRFDLVHAHAHPVWLSGLSGTPMIMSEGSSVAVYLGAYLGWSDQRMSQGFARARRAYSSFGIHHRLLNMERAAKVYLFSEWAREVNLRWGADPSKLEVIYPGFPTPTLSRSETRDTFTFLFVGRDFERKGGYDVIEAFRLLSRDRPEARLVIAGSDPDFRNPDLLIHSWVSAERRQRLEADLESLIRRGVAVRLPAMSHTRLRDEVFTMADAFVMPTNAEGFGFTNVEAMSFGLPVVTSTVGPATEVVSHRETGILVPPADVCALVQAMDELISAPARAAAMGAAGRTLFEQRFTVDHFRENLGGLYAKVVNGR